MRSCVAGWVAVAALGCRTPDPIETGDPTPTVTVTTPPFAVTCERQGNVLRADCTVTGADGPVEIRFAPSDGSLPERVATGTGLVTLYGMVESTSYAWSASPADRPDEEVTGEFETGELPTSAAIVVGGTGASDATESTLFLYGCAGTALAVVAGPDGRVRWYQELATGLEGPLHGAQALTLTPEHTVLATVDRSRVREFDLAGNLLLDAVGVFEERPIHHDVFRRDGYTFVLTAHEEVYDGVTPYVSDGITVLDAAGAPVARWDLDELVTPEGGNERTSGYWTGAFPYAVDWSHANGLYVTEDLDLYVSFYMLDTVLVLEGDPLSPTFGAVRHTLAGSAKSPWWDTADLHVTADPAVTTDVTLEAQHNPSIQPDGRLLLFDNELSPTPSRAVTLALDPDAGIADIEEAYPLPRSCSFEGGAFRLANGNVLATCAPIATFYELAPGVAEPVRTIAPRCARGVFFGYVPRGIPIDL